MPDQVGVFLLNLHQSIGHDKTAAVIGAEAGDKAGCLMCAYEQDPTQERRMAVLAAMAPPETPR